MTKILKTGQRPGFLKISVLRLPARLEFRYLDLEFPQSKQYNHKSKIVNRKSIRLPTKVSDNPGRVAGILPARIVGVSPAVLLFDIFPPEPRILTF